MRFLYEALRAPPGAALADLHLSPDTTAEGASARIEGGVHEGTLSRRGVSSEIEVDGPVEA
ncbi:hypothetical protein [Halospeciosus flavus]|uniref:Uncharacterized protein n=1 Tax=Halospeciosus flavus TaxID=3032283 RepID=A0ABD5Z8W4_9EURY|nr:hypothetical protein [Halospeciosus flavus]